MALIRRFHRALFGGAAAFVAPPAMFLFLDGEPLYLDGVNLQLEG